MPQTPRPTCTVVLLGAFALGTLALGALATPRAAAQQAGRVFRVGVIHQGGPSYYRAIDGLREGLKALGLEEGKHVVLDIRDAKGDLIGALAAYGASFREAGRQAARHVQRILAGTRPQDLPVEAIDRVGLALNLRTEKALGLTIPQSVLVRADELVR